MNIFKSAKNHFRKWCYFDPFSGSGLFDLEIAGNKVKFPGSPLLSYSRHENFPFSEYYFADGKKSNVESLNTRMNSLFPGSDLNYRYSTFSNSVKYFDNLDRDDDSVLAIIDPPGHPQILFEDIQQILEFPAVDMFLTVMTSGIYRNIELSESYDSITSFFGSEDWAHLGSGENIVQEYKSKLESIIGNKIQTISIDMPTQKLYDLFYISRNNTATKILNDIASKLNQITLNDLTSVISKQSPDVKTLFDYDGFNQEN